MAVGDTASTTAGADLGSVELLRVPKYVPPAATTAATVAMKKPTIRAVGRLIVLFICAYLSVLHRRMIRMEGRRRSLSWSA